MGMQDVLESFREEVSAFAATGVVHRVEGTSIASTSEEGVDAQAGEAYLAEVLKVHTQAQSKLGIEGSTEDVVVETGNGVLYARPMGESDYVWTLLTGPDANIALTRAVMRKFHEQVSEALP